MTSRVMMGSSLVLLTVLTTLFFSPVRIRNGTIRRPLTRIHPPQHLPLRLQYKAQAQTTMPRGCSPGALMISKGRELAGAVSWA